MKEHIKNFLNEEQDPKAIEKITTKLANILMKNEEVGYIGVQKKPAITVFPDSIILTNKRIIICKPKNLGLSMDFVDYDWEDISSAFVKENILGSEFSFTTKTELVISINYIPKNQARKLHTFAKEQMDVLKNPIKPLIVDNPTEIINETISKIGTSIEEPIIPIAEIPQEPTDVEEMETEEVTNFAEIIPVSTTNHEPERQNVTSTDKKLSDLSKDELFEKLQNYKKLLDNGLILQGEYDNFKKEILSYL